MNKTEFVKTLKRLTTVKTLYVKGGFGQPLTGSNKKTLIRRYAYNLLHQIAINKASSDTFAFDCIGAVKGVLWSFNFDTSKPFGGSIYCSSGIPDITEDSLIKRCLDVSTDFSNIEEGEYVWIKGHCGIYVGDGLVVECTPKWNGGVQYSSIIDLPGYNRRDWEKHGKLPYVEYTYVPSVLEWQRAAILDGFEFPKYGADGEWGKECEGVATKAIVKAGCKYSNLTKIVQKVVGAGVDGIFGNETKSKVIAYQKKNNLAADGEVGINTWKKILGV